MKKSGFTLVEIMIVVAIIGLLAAVGIPSIMNALTNAQTKAKAKNIASIEKAKGMLQLPSDAHQYGQSLAVGDTFTSDDLFDCMQGTDSLGDLSVGSLNIKINPIGTSAEYITGAASL